MKKLMIAAAIISIAAFTQAASVDWTAKAGWVTVSDKDDSSAFIGNAVYFFDASQYAISQFTTDLADSSIGMKAFDNAFDKTGTILSGSKEGTFNFSGSGLYYDELLATPTVSGYAVLLANDSGKDYAYIIDYGSKDVSDAVIKSGATFNKSEVYTGAVGGAGWYEVASVPEPTSGLLLLLGVAGLALRRRRA